ncbi:hypothetical protein [Paenibacillus lautus]|uniref:hypothetical protein n=1 Tax=Paenibacillus lautus TaxID=1401 RepID=UPI002176D90E|nr:hypothetical protein [Paenibacillus lautus]
MKDTATSLVEDPLDTAKDMAYNMTIGTIELFESKFEGIFKTDYRTAHDRTVDSGRPWYPPEE